MGKEGAGKEGAGKEGAGKKGEGKEGAGEEGAGKEGAGKKGEGKEGAGEEGAGEEGEGKEGAGKEGEGKEGAGEEGEGKEGAGEEGEGKEGAGKKGEGKPRLYILPLLALLHVEARLALALLALALLALAGWSWPAGPGRLARASTFCWPFQRFSGGADLGVLGLLQFPAVALVQSDRRVNRDIQFPIDSAHMHLAALGKIGQQDAQAQRHGEHLLDHAPQRAGTLRLAEAFTAEQIYRAIVGLEDQALIEQARGQFVHLESRNRLCLLAVQRVEDNHIIDAIEELRAERLAQAFHQALALHLLAGLLEVGAEAAGH